MIILLVVICTILAFLFNCLLYNEKSFGRAEYSTLKATWAVGISVTLCVISLYKVVETESSITKEQVNSYTQVTLVQKYSKGGSKGQEYYKGIFKLYDGTLEDFGLSDVNYFNLPVGATITVPIGYSYFVGYYGFVNGLTLVNHFNMTCFWWHIVLNVSGLLLLFITVTYNIEKQLNKLKEQE